MSEKLRSESVITDFLAKAERRRRATSRPPEKKPLTPQARFAEAHRADVPSADHTLDDDGYVDPDTLQFEKNDSPLVLDHHREMQRRLEQEQAQRLLAEKRALQLELQEAKRKLLSSNRKQAIQAAKSPDGLNPDGTAQVKRRLVPSYRFEEYPERLLEAVTNWYSFDNDMKRMVTAANKLLAKYDMRDITLADMYILVSQMHARKLITFCTRPQMSHELTIKQFNAFLRAWIAGHSRELCKDAAHTVAPSGSSNHCNSIFRSLNSLARKLRTKSGRQTKEKLEIALIELFSRARLAAVGETELNSIVIPFKATPIVLRQYFATKLPSQRTLFLYPEIRRAEQFHNLRSLEEVEKDYGNSADADEIANAGDLSDEEIEDLKLNAKEYEERKQRAVIKQRIQSDLEVLAKMLYSKRDLEENDIIDEDAFLRRLSNEEKATLLTKAITEVTGLKVANAATQAPVLTQLTDDGDDDDDYDDEDDLDDEDYDEDEDVIDSPEETFSESELEILIKESIGSLQRSDNGTSSDTEIKYDIESTVEESSKAAKQEEAEAESVLEKILGMPALEKPSADATIQPTDISANQEDISVPEASIKKSRPPSPPIESATLKEEDAAIKAAKIESTQKLSVAERMKMMKSQTQDTQSATEQAKQSTGQPAEPVEPSDQ